jgi:DNA polymerase I
VPRVTKHPSSDPALFGAHPEPGLVAVEHLPDRKGADRVALYVRDGEATTRRVEPFQAFLWVSDEGLLAGAPVPAEFRPLQGQAALRGLALYDSWRDLQKTVAWLKRKTGCNPSDRLAPYYLLNDPVQQHLILSGRTLFQGLRFGELRRLQMDLETYCTPGFDFSNPEREGDRILAIALADQSGWTEVLSGAELDEKTLIERWVACVRERDPDVLEGHNLFKFDLPYLFTRAARHGVALAVGRDGSEPEVRPGRYTVAEQTIAYPRAGIHGRHIVDTYFMAQAYDVTHRSLESLSLKDVAVHFGVAAPDRTYIDGADIARTFDQDPARLMQYARDDILETRAVSDILSPSYFAQAQMLPFSYQNIGVRGTGTKIDALLLRDYVQAGAAIPQPDLARPFAGGYTDIFRTGVVRNVHHCDVRSLYPSLMLVRKIGPARDERGVFLRLLGTLRDVRVDAKQRMQASASPEERRHYDALQTTFKILINSFYGYLGFGQARFSDFDAAERVAAEGRALLQQMIGYLRELGAEPVEIDTDGIYFVPPPDAGGPAQAELRRAFQARLPAGLEVEFDGDYVAMFSYAMKNYALLDAAGEVTIKGAALKSRGLEPFQREYLRRWLRSLLEGDQAGIRSLQQEFRSAIAERRWPIRKLAKTETLQDAPATYAAKIGDKARGRNAAYELALKSGRAYRAGDQVTYYITGTRKSVAAHEAARLVSEFNEAQRDENVAYYLAKLDALIGKFEATPDDDQQGELAFHD